MISKSPSSPENLRFFRLLDLAVGKVDLTAKRIKVSRNGRGKNAKKTRPNKPVNASR